MNRLKFGVFLPKKNHNIDTNLVYAHSPLTNRLPNQEIEKFLGLISDSGVFELIEIPNFNDVIIVNASVLYKDTNLSNLDTFFWYGEIGRENGIYSLDVLKALSQTTKVIPNPYSYEAGLDKYTSHMLLKRKGINVSDLILLSSSNVHLAQPILEEWGCGLLKPRKGGFGKGVTLISSFPMLRDIVEYVDMKNFENTGTSYSGGILLERYYENSIDKFVSTTLIDGEIMYGYRKRTSKLADLGNGYQKIYDFNGIGGEVDICEVLPEHEKQALPASNVLGSEIIGFDMIWHKDRPIIVDENTFPGLYIDLFKQQGISLAHKMYNLILKHSGISHVY
ncbi:MAG: hypothetical protein F6K23_16670 [Okeania sp. SIO2C9]|uniref:ATP-grasp domain-containing protein n=1 Tax=Okeania sp. SIO2C9 TaxID=2607791 RepID=UPI0013BFE23A|nr:hypothetical protein [Okeania sp. SIO2C9]NEQ74525.1 hypothetical protein [Okeania sp. SIO2C9]